MTNETMTKRDFLNAVIESTADENIKAFAENEIAKLDATNAKRREKQNERNEAKDAEAAMIVETFVTDEGMTASDIVAKMVEAGFERADGKAVNVQFVSAALRKAVELGLVTKNAILLVDYANQQRENGVPLEKAVLEACSLRLRPIFMTTFSTILGMMPIALGIGEGAELRQSMGVVLVGGLTTSTLLTLVIIPLIYIEFEKLKEKYYHELGENIDEVKS